MLSSRGVTLILRHENMTNQISYAESIPRQIAITNVVPLHLQRYDVWITSVAFAVRHLELKAGKHCGLRPMS